MKDVYTLTHTHTRAHSHTHTHTHTHTCAQSLSKNIFETWGMQVRIQNPCAVLLHFPLDLTISSNDSDNLMEYFPDLRLNLAPYNTCVDIYSCIGRKPRWWMRE